MFIFFFHYLYILHLKILFNSILRFLLWFIICSMVYLEGIFNFTYAWVWGYLFFFSGYCIFLFKISHRTHGLYEINSWKMLGVAMAEIASSPPKNILFHVFHDIAEDTVRHFTPRCGHGTKFWQWNMHLIGVCLWNYFSEMFTYFPHFHWSLLIDHWCRPLSDTYFG